MVAIEWGPKPRPSKVLSTYRLLPSAPLYHLGSFEQGITIYTQQVRALNLAWAVIRTNKLPNGPRAVARQRIAVVGGGFAGLTFAAALLNKEVAAKVTLLEKRDTILPLQHGCDTRWVHPHIYDWPRPGSGTPNADLPVLAWSAGRASDVVADVADSWSSIVTSAHHVDQRLRVFCNIQHLLITPKDEETLSLDWTGQLRRPSNPSLPPTGPTGLPGATGLSEDFDHVVLAVGFGVEKKNGISYWRNENLAQPQLGQARETYIVSGSGDSALIDLLRLRVAQFRQDRILKELFRERPEVKARLRALTEAGPTATTFDSLKRTLFEEEPEIAQAANGVVEDLRHRLRNDTHVVLHLKGDTHFNQIFEQTSTSFHNRLLAFLLFRCGGFYPSNRDIDSLVHEYEVPKNRLIQRHGTTRVEQITEILSPKLLQEIEKGSPKDSLLESSGDPIVRLWKDQRRISQPVHVVAPGGFFDSPGTKRHNLPRLLELMADSLCSSVSNLLRMRLKPGRMVRVTLNRSIVLGKEVNFQQCCDFHPKAGAYPRTAGRLFDVNLGISGQAYAHKAIIRSRPTSSSADVRKLREELRKLQVPSESRVGRGTYRISSVAAVPFVTTSSTALAPGHIAGILYMDSNQQNFFTEPDDSPLPAILAMCRAFLATIDSVSDPTCVGPITPEPSQEDANIQPEQGAIPDFDRSLLELLGSFDLPATKASQLNLVFS